MPASHELADFIRHQFRSVWSLELLLFLKRSPDRSWSEEELVESLRASHAVVSMSLDILLAGGLIVRDDDGLASYAPASSDLRRLADETESQYARKPDAVRRLIVSSADSGLSAFADSFRLRRD
jgi:hypothetical protein